MGMGVMDWFELYQFGNLNQSDRTTRWGWIFNQRSGELGQEATIFDHVEWGGVGYPPVHCITYRANPPHDLELNNTYALINKAVNTNIGAFIPMIWMTLEWCVLTTIN